MFFCGAPPIGYDNLTFVIVCRYLILREKLGGGRPNMTPHKTDQIMGMSPPIGVGS